MNNKEFYNLLVEQTNDKEVPEKKEYKTLNELLFLLLNIDLSKRVFDEIGYSKHEAEFKELFNNYDPKKIVKNGKYNAQLCEVLDHFDPERSSPYKDFTSAVVKAARYFSNFEDINDLKKNIYLECTDEEKTLEFLLSFRQKASLPSMYFLKTLQFFTESDLLDVPLVNKKSKAVLNKYFDIEDDNVKCYKKLIEIARVNKITLDELNVRIELLPNA